MEHRKSAIHAVRALVAVVLIALFPSPGQGQGKEPTTAGDWYDRGCLLSVYGNEKAAIESFRKALDIDPKNSAALFQMGVSYGQIGNMAEALSSINRAIEMDPENGLYYFGRGRLYLINGFRAQALEEFRASSRLGNGEAEEALQMLAGNR